MSAPPPVAFDYDTRFLPIDLRGDLQAWARAAAKTAWERSGARHGRGDVKGLASTLEMLAEMTLALNPLGAFALVPEPWVGVAGIVRVLAVDLGQPMQPADLVEQLTYPEQDRAAPVETGTIDSPLGTAIWVHQQTHDGDGVSDSRQFVWHFPALEAAVLLTVAFTDPLEAQRWRSALENLARGADLDTSSLTRPS